MDKLWGTPPYSPLATGSTPYRLLLSLNHCFQDCRVELMDQAQTRALAALQPFLHLALTTKSPSPRILANLITRATSAQGTYVFAELLQTPAVQSLRSPETAQEFRNFYTVLEIFSYGTLADYRSSSLPLSAHARPS